MPSLSTYLPSTCLAHLLYTHLLTHPTTYPATCLLTYLPRPATLTPRLASHWALRLRRVRGVSRRRRRKSAASSLGSSAEASETRTRTRETAPPLRTAAAHHLPLHLPLHLAPTLPPCPPRLCRQLPPLWRRERSRRRAAWCGRASTRRTAPSEDHLRTIWMRSPPLLLAPSLPPRSRSRGPTVFLAQVYLGVEQPAAWPVK